MGKLLISLFLLVSFSCFSAEVSQGSGSFLLGTDLLRQDQHAEAAKVLEALARDGVATSELYCNLGNAYFGSGQLGKAVVSYEKALVLSPLDTQLTHNRNAVLRATPEVIVADDNFTDNHIFFFRAGEVSAKTGAFLLFISALLFVLRAFTLTKWFSTKFKVVYKVCLVGAALLLASAATLMVFVETESDAVVIINAVGRSGPSHRAKKVASLTEGEKIQTKKYYQGWYKVETLRGTEAWIESSSLEKYK